jgi:NADH dehydrogenase [ubiquinone] 1 alpha subcomplex assembly factor 1
MHPYLSLRVKNRLAKPASGFPSSPSSPSSASSSASASSSLRSALSSSSSESTPQQRAVHALGLNLPAKAGPKFFVNVQTDGPVTSDLFQHRLYLDESKGNAWQDVVVSDRERERTISTPLQNII